MRADHPLRTIREIANAALGTLSSEFEVLYATGVGRPSIPPERLLRALLLQAFCGVRSERQIMERLEYDLLFRWFVGLGVDDRPGTRPPSPSSGTGCWRATWRTGSSPPSWPIPRSSGCCPASTSASTAR